MSANQRRNKRDWALAQAVENQRLSRRSEQRKLEAQVNTICGRDTSFVPATSFLRYLKALNKARDEGLWDGRAKVFECGSKAMENTEYAKTPLTPAALVDYFIGIGGKKIVRVYLVHLFARVSPLPLPPLA